MYEKFFLNQIHSGRVGVFGFMSDMKDILIYDLKSGNPMFSCRQHFQIDSIPWIGFKLIKDRILVWRPTNGGELTSLRFWK